MALTDKEVELEIAKLHESGRNERQKNYTTMIIQVVGLVIGALNAGLLVSNRINQTSDHQETVAEVKRVYADTPSITQVKQIAEKVDATNMQWKAYNTKAPEDEKKAAEVLTKAVEKME